jgi:hypothetical protein
MRSSLRRTFRNSGIAFVSLLLAMFLIDTVYPFVWFSMPISGTVVETQSGRGVAGATVAFTWMLTGLEGAPVRHLYVAEAITDREGRFSLGAWGPRLAFGDGRLRADEPKVVVLADDHTPRLVFRRLASGTAPLILTYGYVRSTPIALTPASSNDGQLEQAYWSVLTSLNVAYLARSCEWKKLPRTFESLDRMRTRMHGRGVVTEIPSLETMQSAHDCGSSS